MKQNDNGFELDGISSLLNEEEKPSKIYFRKYWTYILSKKIWVIGCAVLMGVAGFFVYPWYKAKKTEYNTSAMIRFDDTRSSRGISAVTDFSAGIVNAGNIKILETNLFLNKVVDSLKLNLLVDKNIPRSEFIKSVNFADDIQFGSYYFLISYDIRLYYTDPYTDTEKILLKYPLKYRDSLYVDINGIKGLFSIPKWYSKEKLKFVVISNPEAIEYLYEKLYYNVDRESGTILTLSFADHDPFFAKTACNTIAELFIEQLIEFKKGKTTSILKSLEEQLAVAERELAIADRNLQDFQEKNPRVYFNTDNSLYIENLGQKEIEILSIDDIQSEINFLENKLGSANRQQVNYVYQEILSFLDQQNLPGIASLLTNFNQQTANLNFALSQFSETHPEVLKIETEISSIKKETRNRLNTFKNSLNSKKSNLAGEVSAARSTLVRLPSKQLKLAELQRKRLIKESIVSSIMARYNEAVVSDAAVFPNANIIDYAEEPLYVEVGFVIKVASIAIGGLLGGVLAVGVLVVIVLINARFWTTDEIEEKTELPVIAKLPVLKQRKKYPYTAMQVTSSYKPSYTGESFRRMRTILDLKRNKSKKVLIVGSLNPSEGKSFVSINLATVYAQQGKKVLLIDGDIRKGVLHEYFRKKITPGLTNVLQDNEAIDLEYSYKYLRVTHTDNLFFIPAGELVPNPSEIIGSQRFYDLLKTMNRVFDEIIIDSAPFGLCPDLFIINKWIHSILLVTKYQSTDLVELNKAISEVSNLRKDFEGIVTNFIPEKNKKYEGYNLYQY